ncbi:probable ATP-dependent RNA helicase ddx17 [Stegodyphus dumicola]|uniref:probable ATP-dependent RNA helicase ddx17 n=1 Tax=Stegodyphus dumicola TaxID=202533 RepID=UPI0015B250BE|nr:probable ATP-dependent RNA helicase ddx17 [Stegodyphus dumicola]XP_035206102.1 probable ATP-dependent RNA helicase ddx17 [Stegodyphus dumicola]
MFFQFYSGFFLSVLLSVVLAYPPYGAQVQHQYIPVHTQHAPSVQYQAAPVQYQAAPVQYEAAPVQYQAVPVEYAHAPVQYQHLQEPQIQSVPVAYAQVQPSILSSGEESHGVHGQQLSGHSQAGSNEYVDKFATSEKAAAAHGHHNTGALSKHAAQGAKHSHQGTYHNTGSYSQDKGSGYEKSYSYDRASGFHDITAHDAAHSDSYGTKNEQGHHSVGAQSVNKHAKESAHSKAGSSSHSAQAHNSALFKKYGYTNGGAQDGYSYSPVYGYGYH